MPRPNGIIMLLAIFFITGCGGDGDTAIATLPDLPKGVTRGPDGYSFSDLSEASIEPPSATYLFPSDGQSHLFNNSEQFSPAGGSSGGTRITRFRHNVAMRTIGNETISTVTEIQSNGVVTEDQWTFPDDLTRIVFAKDGYWWQLRLMPDECIYDIDCLMPTHFKQGDQWRQQTMQTFEPLIADEGSQYTRDIVTTVVDLHATAPNGTTDCILLHTSQRDTRLDLATDQLQNEMAVEAITYLKGNVGLVYQSDTWSRSSGFSGVSVQWRIDEPLPIAGEIPPLLRGDG